MKYTEVDLAFDEKPEESGGAKSFWEVLAQQRDAKRRRLNYRQAKKVHTKHKSQTEVTREVIENQMELYTEWLQQNNSDHQSQGKIRQSTEETEGNPTSQSVYEDKCSFQHDFQNNTREKYSDREKYSGDRSYDRHNHSHSSRHKREYTDRSRSSSKYHGYEDTGKCSDHNHKRRDHRESRSHSRSDDRHSRKKHKHSSKR
ncbi:hypothetical protein B566_EDAN003957 [Ephemera danica]|nr:hypothetical protein B566_EDAN003957 [Ephemera danica]